MIGAWVWILNLSRFRLLISVVCLYIVVCILVQFQNEKTTDDHWCLCLVCDSHHRRSYRGSGIQPVPLTGANFNHNNSRWGLWWTTHFDEDIVVYDAISQWIYGADIDDHEDKINYNQKILIFTVIKITPRNLSHRGQPLCLPIRWVLVASWE